jgi:hypothetical protein
MGLQHGAEDAERDSRPSGSTFPGQGFGKAPERVNAPMLSWTEQVLHKVLHIYPPERPTTSFYAPKSPTVINNMRKAEAFRNRQVTGSIPVVGSRDFKRALP